MRAIACSPSLSASLRPVAIRAVLEHASHYSTATKPRRSTLTTPSVMSSVEDAVERKSNLHDDLPSTRQSSLAILPLTNLLRNYLITTISTTPFLLKPAMGFLSLVVHSKSSLLDPDTNRVLGGVLRQTFYNHFCAGENEKQVRGTVASLRSLGFEGAILAFAREIVIARGQQLSVSPELSKHEQEQIEAWRDGTLKTVELAGETDMVALKFSGAGEDTVARLIANSPPSKLMHDSLVRICDLAAERGVPLLFDAEQESEQKAIDAWTLDFMAKYNSNSRPAVVYNTYQAYLKDAGSKLAEHLLLAERKGFKLGVKLVRGAYLGSDPREVIWETKEETDQCFDGIVQSLLTGEWASSTQSGAEISRDTLLATDIVIASHNQESVTKARAIEATLNRRPGSIVYAQLMGMADDLSCELVASSDPPKVLKYVVWGTTHECLHYLLRRANENKDALGRTLETHREVRRELGRRIRTAFGL